MERDLTEILKVGSDECTVILRRVEDDFNFGLSLAGNGDAEVTIGLALASDVTSAMEHFMGLATVANDSTNIGNSDSDELFCAQLTFEGLSNEVRWSLTLQGRRGQYELVLVTNELGDDRRIDVRLDRESVGRIVASARRLVAGPP